MDNSGLYYKIELSERPALRGDPDSEYRSLPHSTRDRYSRGRRRRSGEYWEGKLGAASIERRRILVERSCQDDRI